MEIDFGIYDYSEPSGSENSYSAARKESSDEKKDKKSGKKKGSGGTSSDHQSFDSVQAIASISMFS